MRRPPSEDAVSAAVTVTDDSIISIVTRVSLLRRGMAAREWG
jgi:hypothetical protein